MGTALFDFMIAKAIAKAPETSKKKRLLVVSIVMNLGVLGFFKYTNFFIGSVYGLLNVFHFNLDTPILHIFLPVGISFYTFQSMSYTIDVYRGALQARENPLEFVAGVSFFPHLVAGPIIRSSTLLPQFEKFQELPDQDYRNGVIFFMTGLCNKTVADLLGLTADGLFNGSGHGAILATWTGVLAFAGQLYGDFSGYTDMAIGVALLLGFRLPANFNLPYIASSPIDVWRRWHISLSTWLRDYLYMPLVTRDYERGRATHPYRSMFITIVLAGLWHGSTWTFVVWGMYEGTKLSLNHFLFDKFPKLRVAVERGSWRICGVLITFYLWLIGLVMFRANNFTRVVTIVSDMHWPSQPSVLTYSGLVALLLTLSGIVGSHLLSFFSKQQQFINRRPLIVWPAMCILVALALAYAGTAQPFIYFQF